MIRNSREDFTHDFEFKYERSGFISQAMKKFNNRDKIIGYDKSAAIKDGSTQSSNFSDTIKRMAAGNHIMTHGGVGR